jgi:formiminotetrahydrofolate cyclodeaminase
MPLFEEGDGVEHISDKNFCGIVTEVNLIHESYNVAYYDNRYGTIIMHHTRFKHVLTISSEQLNEAHQKFLDVYDPKGAGDTKLIRKIKKLDKKWETHIKAKGPSFVISPVKAATVKTTTPSTQTDTHIVSDVGRMSVTEALLQLYRTSPYDDQIPF